MHLFHGNNLCHHCPQQCGPRGETAPVASRGEEQGPGADLQLPLDMQLHHGPHHDLHHHGTRHGGRAKTAPASPQDEDQGPAIRAPAAAQACLGKPSWRSAKGAEPAPQDNKLQVEETTGTARRKASGEASTSYRESSSTTYKPSKQSSSSVFEAVVAQPASMAREESPGWAGEGTSNKSSTSPGRRAPPATRPSRPQPS